MLSLPNTARPATFGVFYPLWSTHAPHFKLLQLLADWESANQIPAHCFSPFLPKKKNLLLWTPFNSWRLNLGHRFSHLRYSLLCLHHENQGVQVPTWCEARSPTRRAEHPLERGLCSSGCYSTVMSWGKHKQALWTSSKTALPLFSNLSSELKCHYIAEWPRMPTL